MNRPLLVHVGYHKSATTWLQRALFRREMGYRQLMTHEEVFKTIVRPHGLTFDSSCAKALIATRTKNEECLQVDVISSEILSGHPFFGGRESDQYALRLHAVAPNALILISIREQFSAMTSIYMQYLSRGGTVPAGDFFADEPVIGFSCFSPEHLEFHRLVGLYRTLFGPERVLVITKENLDLQPSVVINRIAAFCGNEARGHLSAADTKRIGASYPEYIAFLLRRINHFRSGPVHPRPLLNLGAAAWQLYRVTGAVAGCGFMMGLYGQAKPITHLVRKRFRGRFAESNRALKAMVGAQVDLAGYEMDG